MSNEYALYLRKSRADEEAEARGEGETLARHKKILLNLAKKMKINVTKTYPEIVSGETIAARPVVQQMLSDVEQNKWTGILVMEVERLARGDTIDQGIVARTFKESSTKIITPMKIYDPNNEYDEEYFEFGLFMSRREYKTINRRIQTGRLASAKEGKAIVSTASYGYKKVKLTNDKGYTFEIVPSEANIVKLIFQWYNSGYGMGEIASRLDNIGIKPRISKYWSKATIKDMLKNPVYIGKIRWGYEKEKKINEGNKLIKKRYKDKEYIYVNGLHKPIIDEETFNNAQKQIKLNTNKRTHKNLKLQNPLSGLVYCKKCGKLMTRYGANSHHNYDVLRCPNRHCNSVDAPIFLVEKKIVASVLVKLHNYQVTIKKDDMNDTDDQTQTLMQALSQMDANLNNLDIQISRTYDLLEQGIYSIDVFTKRNQELAQRKTELTESIRQITEEIKNIEKNKKISTETIPKMVRLLEEYEELDSAEDKNALLKQVIYRVEYSKEKPNKKWQLNNDESINLNIILKLPLSPI